MGYPEMTVMPFSFLYPFQSYRLFPPINSFAIILPDSGAMGSFVVFHLAGLYPVPATQQFLLSSPYFPSVSFFNPLFNTKTTIRTKNFSPQAIFVKVCRVSRVIFKGEWTLTDCARVWVGPVYVERDSGRKSVEIELLHRVGRVCTRRDSRA